MAATLFLNRVNILEPFCLLRDGFILAMKNASKFLRVLPFFGAESKILHKKLCYQEDVWLALIHDQQNYVLINVLQHYESPQLPTPL